MDIILWLVVAAIMVVFEIISLGLTTIWFAGGAIVAAVSAYLSAAWLVQVVVFAVASLVMLIFTRPIAQKHLMKTNEPTNIDSYIGMEVDVIKDIDGRRGGQVKLNGIEWSAITTNDENIQTGKVAVVKAISGNKLIVESKS